MIENDGQMRRTAEQMLRMYYALSDLRQRVLPVNKRSYELFARYVMPEFQDSLTTLRASNEWARENRKEIFSPSVEAVKRAFTDAGRAAPADLADRALGGRDVRP